MPPCLIITSNDKWNNIFHKKLIFNTLTDEHILRLLFIQKIKIAKKLNEVITIYLDNIELDEMNINPKLIGILKYRADIYNIHVRDICNGYDEEQIKLYSKIVSDNKDTT
tara:strand:- start:2815 stop:3144 length:330 start_codon:yes stop_codon:yes gene_type:complete